MTAPVAMTAFITRALTDDSEFKKQLAAAGWQVEGQSLVTLSPLPFSEIPTADWVFFFKQKRRSVFLSATEK